MSMFWTLTCKNSAVERDLLGLRWSSGTTCRRPKLIGLRVWNLNLRLFLVNLLECRNISRMSRHLFRQVLLLIPAKVFLLLLCTFTFLLAKKVSILSKNSLCRPVSETQADPGLRVITAQSFISSFQAESVWSTRLGRNAAQQLASARVAVGRHLACARSAAAFRCSCPRVPSFRERTRGGRRQLPPVPVQARPRRAPGFPAAAQSASAPASSLFVLNQ